MTESKDQAQSLFLNALEIPTEDERAAYLEVQCGANPELRQEVQELLDHARRLGPFLEPAEEGVDGTVAHPISERPGTIIGPYKLLQQIGEGGMGVVFMAEQTEPIQRTVALKIIKPGMDTRQVIARFEAERQALALMDHPNIARVIDAGVVGPASRAGLDADDAQESPARLAGPTGRPYFVMDLVKGVPITDYCDAQHLSVRQRLELFTQVCHAVQHAHQKGIIHRDLKPSNVLVAEYDGKPVPKVIDFGVAKATAQRLTEKTMFTELGQMVGTVEYMSPEQARFNQLDVDTRSDIYSLGVLLYELLAGSTPFGRKRLNEAAFDEMLRIIREEEPPKPSTRLSSLSSRERAIDSLPLAGRVGEGADNSLSLAERAGERGTSLASIAANRHTEPARLSKDVRGELDWIVMKALEKDRNRRYETASGFAADIERHLRDEPVEAGPPSRAYRFRKFASRNKPALLTATLVAAALILGTVASTWQAIRASRAEAESRQREVEMQAVVDFLVNDLLAAPINERKLEREITVSEVLVNAEAKIGAGLDDQPLVEAAVRHVMAKSYQALTKPEKAEPHARRALELRTELLGPTHHDTLESTTTMAEVLVALDKQVDARQLCEEALYASRGALGPQHADTIDSMNRMVWVILQGPRQDASDIAEAMKLCEEALQLGQQYLGADHRHTLRASSLKAELLYHSGEKERAEELWRNTLDVSQRVFGPSDSLTLAMSRNIANVYSDRQQFLDSIKLYEEVLERQRQELGPKDPETLATLKLLGRSHHLLNQFDEARKLYEEGLEASRQLYGTDHPSTRDWKHWLVFALRGQGKFEEAYRLQRENVDWRRQNLGIDNRYTLSATQQLAYDLALLERHDECLKLCDETILIARRVLKPDDPTLLLLMTHRAHALRKQGKLIEARQAMEEVVAGVRRLPQSNRTPDIIDVHLSPRVSLARWLAEDGETTESIKLIDEILNHLPPNDWYYRNLLAWRLATTNSDEIRDGPRALEIATKACELTEYKAATTLDTLAGAYAETGDFESAIKWCEKAIELGSARERERFEKHLDNYRQRKPWRSEW